MERRAPRRPAGPRCPALHRQSRRTNQKPESCPSPRTSHGFAFRIFFNIRSTQPHKETTMSKMKAVQVGKPGGNFEIVERNIPEPARNQVRIKVEACGICHSDALVKEGQWPGIQYPRVPGHEIAGRIDAIGADVTLWKPGQRVGVGWHGGHCFQCDPCRSGDFMLCQFEKITAIHFDGGYAEYMLAPAEAVAAMPDD